MKQLKQVKSYVGFLLFFSFFLQVSAPLIAATYDYNPAQNQEQTGLNNSQNLVIDDNLAQCIRAMVHDAIQADVYDELPESVKCCYRNIVNNEIGLPTNDVMQALPNILDYAFEQAYESTRAIRPDASNNEIVGAGIGCDLIPALMLLKLIKNRIGSVADNVCCDSVLGILGDACKKFGSNSNISCKIQEIIQEIIDTRSTLCNKFNQTFTIFENITEEILKNRVSTCEKFQQTWTILDQILQRVIEINKDLDECCEKIDEDIFGTKTTICNKIELIESCDFIILNSNPEDKSNIHVITDPITMPGLYCVGEDLNGTLDIHASNVTVKFNGYALHASSTAIESNGFNHIRIEDGFVTGADPAISISNGIGIKIANMELNGNNVGVKFDTVKDFTIHDCRFRKSTGTAMNLTSSDNGKITCCQIHDNNDIESLIVINLSGCKQLFFEDIVITENTNITTFIGINASTTHECCFNNIQITCNTAIESLKGIFLENGDNNTFKECTVNKNKATSSNAVTTFTGIEVTASIDSGSKNNSIICCQVHENESRSTGSDTIAYFVGVNIAGLIAGGSINDNVGAGTTIHTCSVQNNTCLSQNGSSFFIGINLAGVIVSGTVANGACANCTIINCTVNKSVSEGRSNTYFTGINLAGIQAAGLIGMDACKNCHVDLCDVSGNTSTSNFGNNTIFFVGINFGGGLNGGTVGDNVCMSCFVINCTVNNNTSGSSSNSNGIFVGINLGGSLGNTIGTSSCGSSFIDSCTINDNTGRGNNVWLVGINLGGVVFFFGTVNADACASCSVGNCAISNNSCRASGIAFFVGINLGGTVFAGTVNMNGCVSCSVSNCAINKNICRSTTNDTFFVGINVGGAIRGGTVDADVGTSCFICNCTIASSTCDSTSNAFFVGINQAGTINGGTIGDRACTSCTVSNVTVGKNTCSSGSNFTAFFVGINSGGIILSGTVSVDACASCTVNDCSVNKNTCGSTRAFFVGINLAGIVGNGVVNSNVCVSCSLGNCFINSNICNTNANFPAFFVGINLAGKISEGTVQGNGCNDCKLSTLCVVQNTITSTNNSSFLYGVYMNGQPGASAGGCNDIVGVDIVVGGNTVVTQGEFIGIFIDGTGVGARGCNNISLKMCEVYRNTGIGDSRGYKMVGADKNNENGGARNLQFEDCMAKQNISSGSCFGFDIQETANAVVLQCTSVENTSDGFLIKDIINSCLRECKAIKNGNNGFHFDGETSKTTITDSIATANKEDGFLFGPTTIQCYAAENIAESNESVGFTAFLPGNNIDFNVFVRNHAQFNSSGDYSATISSISLGDLSVNSFSNTRGL